MGLKAEKSGETLAVLFLFILNFLLVAVKLYPYDTPDLYFQFLRCFISLY